MTATTTAVLLAAPSRYQTANSELLFFLALGIPVLLAVAALMRLRRLCADLQVLQLRAVEAGRVAGVPRSQPFTAALAVVLLLAGALVCPFAQAWAFYFLAVAGLLLLVVLATTTADRVARLASS